MGKLAADNSPKADGSLPDAGILPYARIAQPQGYKVGTLTYTKFGLVMVFIWLLWGDFVFTLLDTNLPTILPLKLKQMGAHDATNSILNKSFSYAMMFVFAPVVSFSSDRTRTRWGRRIPYLIWSTPFVGLFFILIGYYDSLTKLITGGAAQVQFFGTTLTQATVSIAVFGALLIGWDFANVFVNTVYWYLFNDVVPSAFLSRFLSLFRIVGTLAGMAYNRWVFPQAIDHFRTIFVIAGIAYVVGFMTMCFFVREGQYPPPPENADKRPGLLSAAKTYARDCFTHRLYWYFFLSTACTYTANLAMSTYSIIRDTGTLGITLKDLGDYRNWVLLISLLLQFPAGWLADRWHPLPIYLLARVWGMLGALVTCVWIFRDFGPDGNLRFMYWTGLLFMPLGIIAEAAELPMYMRLLPKDRYGQFCSANAMVRALALILGGIAVGIFIGSLADAVGEWRYRYIPLWTLFWQLSAAVFLYLLYREWKRLGGKQSYVPPGTELEIAAT